MSYLLTNLEVGGRGSEAPPPTTYLHALNKKHALRIIETKRKVKNSACSECGKRERYCRPLKLESSFYGFNSGRFPPHKIVENSSFYLKQVTVSFLL